MKIATQVVDTTYGQSAAGVRVRLECVGETGWTTLADAETNSNGCINDWDSCPLQRGLYRIVLDSDRYFAGLGAGTAYPEVMVIFRMRNESDGCQVQVALSPYSYSAYFGSFTASTELQI